MSNSYILFFVVEHFAVGRRLSRLLSEIIVAVDLLAVRAIVSLLELFFFGISSGDSQPFYLAYPLLLLRPGYGLDDWTWSWAEWMYSQFVFVFICCFVFHAFIYL